MSKTEKIIKTAKSGTKIPLSTEFYKVSLNINGGKKAWNNCDALRHLVPFVQFKNREKHPWRNVTFSKSYFTTGN